MSNRPPRLPDFSYAGQLRYFLTVCVNQRLPVFADETPARFVLTQFLLLAASEGFEVLAYCVMPDHFHALVMGNTDAADLKRLMHRWKLTTGYWWKQRGHVESLWQRGYYDRVLRDSDPTEGAVRYILFNPVRAGLVPDSRQYPFLGSSQYDVRTMLESTVAWEPSWK